MKKHYLLILMLLLGVSGAFAVEDMRFVTTLSAPLAVFDKVETSAVNEPAKAKKATVGVLTRSDKSFNTTLRLSTKKAHLRTLQLSRNTTLSSTSVPQWKTPKIVVNNGASLTGKQLRADKFDFKGSNTNSVNADNVTVTNSMEVASVTATNELKIANKAWYQTVNSVPQGGDAVWNSLSGGSDGNKTFTNILYYSGTGPTSGASSGKWTLESTTPYSSCVAGSVLRDSCQTIAGRSGSSVANTSCNKCGVSCVYIPCVSGNFYQEYKYTCTC